MPKKATKRQQQVGEFGESDWIPDPEKGTLWEPFWVPFWVQMGAPWRPRGGERRGKEGEEEEEKALPADDPKTQNREERRTIQALELNGIQCRNSNPWMGIPTHKSFTCELPTGDSGRGEASA